MFLWPIWFATGLMYDVLKNESMYIEISKAQKQERNGTLATKLN